MLYSFIKIIARAALHLYCRDLKLNNPALLNSNGPLMLSANHPNSFLDAIILCTLFDQPVYSLARGDAFKGSLVTKILLSLKLLPVYRVSEGVENLEENYKTFETCKEIFKKNGIVLIFSEGRCVNEWHLRPLKKGTARLALSSWADGIPLQVLPVGINYSSFKKFGKNVHLYFGKFITAEDIDMKEGIGKSIQYFNANLQQQLENFVYEIDPSDKQKIHEKFVVTQPTFKRAVLMLPSLIGYLLNAPLYLPLKNYIQKKTFSTDHFDSLVVALLFLIYPLYVGLITLLVFLYTGDWKAFVLLAIFPCTAWAHLQLKQQVD